MITGQHVGCYNGSLMVWADPVYRWRTGHLLLAMDIQVASSNYRILRTREYTTERSG